MCEALEKQIQAKLDEWDVNGTVCATRDGQTLFSGARGMADRENGLLYGRDTKTYVASVTKQFTAACVMMLRERGLIDLEAKLEKYIPEYRHAGEMTLRQMLNMTSGIPHELDVIDRRLKARRAQFLMSDRDFRVMCCRACAPEKCAPEDFIRLVNDEPLEFAPGENFQYSDTNYMLAGEIVARISGMPLCDFMRTHIFEPLGMAHTVLGADLSDAPSYADFDGALISLGRAHFVTGEGSICTTAEDLCLWLNNALSGGLLSPESWRECLTMVNGYGFGWAKNGAFFAHGGGDLGYASYVAICFDTGTAFASALNTSDDAPDGRSFVRDMLALLA